MTCQLIISEDKFLMETTDLPKHNSKTMSMAHQLTLSLKDQHYETINHSVKWCNGCGQWKFL